MIAQFERPTGVPLIINTSFNVRGEPIVCTPHGAYLCFMRTNMDHLVLRPCLLDKKEQPPHHSQHSLACRRPEGSPRTRLRASASAAKMLRIPPSLNARERTSSRRGLSRPMNGAYRSRRRVSEQLKIRRSTRTSGWRCRVRAWRDRAPKNRLPWGGSSSGRAGRNPEAAPCR